MTVSRVSLRSLTRYLALPAALMLLGGLGTTSVQAGVTFEFTSAINDDLSNGTSVEPGDLPATVTVNFDDTLKTLDITIDNQTDVDGALDALIRQFYFNAANVETLSFAGGSIADASAGQWVIHAPSQGDGFGQFDYELSFGGQRTDWVGPGDSRTISFSYTGTISNSDLLAFSSGNNPAQAVVHWVPVDESLESGYGSGNPNPVPEPATFAAALSGLILVGLCRLRRRREATSA